LKTLSPNEICSFYINALNVAEDLIPNELDAILLHEKRLNSLDFVS